jgi:hypothetical protein
VLITVLGNRIQSLIRCELTDSVVQLPGTATSVPG